MEPSVETWFARRRLGLFVHFGLYSIEGWHEQEQMRRGIARAEYAKRLAAFHPRNFDPDAWIDLAESAGMEYLCFTTKHHEGFCLWDTQLTDFNVMRTPCGRDLLAELAAACHRRNFPLGLYYSVVDWHHPNYPNEGRHHELDGPAPGDAPDWEAYMEFLKGQVRELCSRYGQVRHFFWDMNVPGHTDPSVNALIRELQPGIVINDRGFDAGDFGTPERDYNDAEVKRQVRFSRPTEACNSVGAQSWGYRKDEDYFAPSHLIRNIAGIMAKGGHYLLNAGPDGNGEFPPEARGVLAVVGDWYARVREAYGACEPASEWCDNRDVLLTRRENTIYVHVPGPLACPAVALPPITRMPETATLLNDGSEVRVSDDPLPVYWRSGAPYLVLKDLPVALAAKETLVVRLEFETPLTADGVAVEAYEG